MLCFSAQSVHSIIGAAENLRHKFRRGKHSSKRASHASTNSGAHGNSLTLTGKPAANTRPGVALTAVPAATLKISAQRSTITRRKACTAAIVRVALARRRLQMLSATLCTIGTALSGSLMTAASDLRQGHNQLISNVVKAGKSRSSHYYGVRDDRPAGRTG